MKKRLVSTFILVCLVCCTMCGCGAKKNITAKEALAVVLEDLGGTTQTIGEPHIHTGTYHNKDCYNVYLTVNGESWVYVVSFDGELLTKQLGGHSH